MNNTELKKALIKGQAVQHTDFMHQVDNAIVSAIIYRVDKLGKLKISAELKDKAGTTYIVDPKKIILNKNKNEKEKTAAHRE